MLVPWTSIDMFVPVLAIRRKPRILGIIETRGLNAVGLRIEAIAPVTADTHVKNRTRERLGMDMYLGAIVWRIIGKASHKSMETAVFTAPQRASRTSRGKL